MTYDHNGQGLIDFSKAFTPAVRRRNSTGPRRKQVREIDAVPEWEVAQLDNVRFRTGLTYADIADYLKINECSHGGFVNRTLTGRQRISREEFDKIFIAVAKLVFRKILDA